MTTAAHTPGPWRVFDGFTDLEIVSDRATAHETESIVQFKGQPNAKANARLMAASPDMLAALHVAQDQLEQFMASDKEGRDTDLRQALGDVREAIAKAIGREAP